jgi:hypothetical protein
MFCRKQDPLLLTPNKEWILHLSLALSYDVTVSDTAFFSELAALNLRVLVFNFSNNLRKYIEIEAKNI